MMVRPRFSDMERILLIRALRNYATHLAILQAEKEKEKWMLTVYWWNYKQTYDLETFRKYEALKDKLEKSPDARYSYKAEAALLIARRLETMVLFVNVKGHHLNSACHTRHMLRGISEEAWTLPH